MECVKIFDNERKHVVEMVLDGNNKIEYNYFRRTFPTATGLLERQEDAIFRSVRKNKNKILNETFLAFFSIPTDENDKFTWNWDNNVVYDLIYSDRRKKNLRKYVITYNLFVFQQVKTEFYHHRHHRHHHHHHHQHQQRQGINFGHG